MGDIPDHVGALTCSITIAMPIRVTKLTRRRYVGVHDLQFQLVENMTGGNPVAMNSGSVQLSEIQLGHSYLAVPVPTCQSDGEM